MTTAAVVEGPTDEQLAELLAARDREEEERAKVLARGLLPDSPCPVCGEALDHCRGFVLLRPVLRRGTLECRACGFRAESVPSSFGWSLALALALTAALAGAAAVTRVQTLADPTARSAALLGGLLLMGGGLFAGFQAQGLGDTQGTARRIVRGWRRRRGEPEEHAVPTGWVSENLEAVVVAVILALIIRHFAMEAFVIPTGSMAPTLLGDHFMVRCPRCANAFALSKAEDELQVQGERETVTARCPLCDEIFDRDVGKPDVHGGNKILVNKFIYKLRPPRRFEVVVFKFPEEPWKNYIKRLVGLPGDRLRVKNGDLWVNDVLARKPDDVQDAVWIPVHDAAHLPADDPAPWREVPRDGDEREPSGAWSLGTGARLACAPRPGETAWLEYANRIYDRYGYTREPEQRRFTSVADLRVTARVTAAEGAVVRLAVAEDMEDGRGPRVVAARVPVGVEGVWAIEVDGEAQTLPKVAPGLVPGATHEVSLCYADDRARIVVDGEAVLAWDDPFGPRGVTKQGTARLSAEGAPVTFERPRIDRDIYYVSSVGSHDPADEEVVVPDGCYFVMGDNSPNSQDGRNWGFVHQGHLIGRAFLVFWPVIPNQVKRIR